MDGNVNQLRKKRLKFCVEEGRCADKPRKITKNLWQTKAGPNAYRFRWLKTCESNQSEKMSRHIFFRKSGSMTMKRRETVAMPSLSLSSDPKIIVLAWAELFLWQTWINQERKKFKSKTPKIASMFYNQRRGKNTEMKKAETIIFSIFIISGEARSGSSQNSCDKITWNHFRSHATHASITANMYNSKLLQLKLTRDRHMSQPTNPDPMSLLIEANYSFWSHFEEFDDDSRDCQIIYSFRVICLSGKLNSWC